jgi:hypothetical protein
MISRLMFPASWKVAVLALLTAWPALVSAVPVELFTTGGPNNQQWRNSDLSKPSEAADDFMLGSDGFVTGVQWYGSYLFFPSQPQPDDFTIHFYADDAGLPMNDPFHTATFTGAVDRTFTGIVAPGDFQMFEYSVDIDPLFLSAGTKYWLSIANDTSATSAPGSTWAWAYATGGTTHAWRGPTTTGPIPWTPFGSKNLSFTLTGTTSLVAEPTSLLLLGIGLLVVASCRAGSGRAVSRNRSWQA